MNYDIVIVGAGGVGSAAAYHAAKRGLRVLALDRFPPGHDRGSSHGQTRIIRQAYFEHPDYVPLLFRAYELWRELEETTGESLLSVNGLLQIGPPDGEVVQGVLESAKRWNLPIERLSEAEFRKRFPQFHFPEGCDAVYEAEAGVLRVEACVKAHAIMAMKCGAEIREGVNVQGVSSDGSGVRILTDQGVFHAAQAILAPGAWAHDLLGALGVSFQVLRKHLHWFAAERGGWKTSESCPSFLYELPHGTFYGLPAIDGQGVKVGEHSGGAVVADPLHDDRSVEVDDQFRVGQFVATQLRGLGPAPIDHKTCFYTMSPDQHFVVGRLPEIAKVAFAGGLSGHGFKFTGVLGEALVSLALGETPRVSVDFLSPSRFSRSSAR